MKFQITVFKDIIEVMFDSETEINILFYLMILKLKLIIKSNVIIYMKNISNKSLHMIKYILEISMQIENMII